MLTMKRMLVGGLPGLDIMSVVPDLVGAETFATVDLANNRKLASDLKKMTARTEQHRYIFFMAANYPGARRWPKLERDGVQVWSVAYGAGNRAVDAVLTGT
jgi:hypothetical protein